MIRVRLRALALCASILLAATPLCAHDYWLELSSWAPRPGESVVVTHLVGERLAGETVGKNPAAIVRFDAVEEDGASRRVTLEPVPHRAGRFLAGEARTTRVVYQSLPAFATLSAEKFDRYLDEERLEPIRELRRTLGESERPAREAFSRSAIAVACGGASGAPAPSGLRAAGLELEIVPESDPCGAGPGSELGFQLLRDGRPAAGVVMRALARGRPGSPIESVTDGDGRFRIRFDSAGLWLIKGVAMERAAGFVEAEWRSRWASLTFDLRPSGRPEPPPGEMARVKALVEAGELEAARARLEPIVRDHPDWGRATLLLAVIELRENRFERARTLFERAATLDPDEVSGRLFLGWCLLYLGELEAAERSVRAFLDRVPDHAEGWYALGRIAFEGDRVDEARAALARSRDLAAGSGDRLVEGRARARLGELLARVDDLPAARRELEAASALLPDSREVWHRLSRVLERSGLATEAAAARARAAALVATEERDRWEE